MYSSHRNKGGPNNTKTKHFQPFSLPPVPHASTDSPKCAPPYNSSVAVNMDC